MEFGRNVHLAPYDFLVPASTVQPLVVEIPPTYEISTPHIPGLPLEPPTGRSLYLTSTPQIVEGLDHTVGPVYTIGTPMLPGIEQDAGAGPLDIDETYGRTTLQVVLNDHLDEIIETAMSLDNRGWVADLDETYEPTELLVFTPAVIGFAPVMAEAAVVQQMHVGDVTIELDPVLS